MGEKRIIVEDEVLRLDKKGQETLIAMLAHPSLTAAAKNLGIERSTLYHRMDKYQLNKIIDRLPEEALKNIKLGTMRASEILRQGMEQGRIRDKKDFADDVLDRAGLGRGNQGPAVVQQFNQNLNLSDANLERITD